MYGVKFVEDHELPEGREWMLTHRRDTGRTRLWVTRSAVCERVLEEAWAGYRLLLMNQAREALVELPRQRHTSPSPDVASSGRRANRGG